MNPQSFVLHTMYTVCCYVILATLFPNLYLIYQAPVKRAPIHSTHTMATCSPQTPKNEGYLRMAVPTNTRTDNKTCSHIDRLVNDACAHHKEILTPHCGGR